MKPFIKIKDLHPGTCYVGHCRNASLAYWSGRKFYYLRTMFEDTFVEEIEHPEKDRLFDVFYPEAAAAYTKDTRELIDAVDRYRAQLAKR